MALSHRDAAAIKIQTEAAAEESECPTGYVE